MNGHMTLGLQPDRNGRVLSNELLGELELKRADCMGMSNESS